MSKNYEQLVNEIDQVSKQDLHAKVDHILKILAAKKPTDASSDNTINEIKLIVERLDKSVGKSS